MFELFKLWVYRWVIKHLCLAVNQAIFDTFLPNTLSKPSAPKTLEARRVLLPKTPSLIARAPLIMGRASQTAGQGPGFWETFCYSEISINCLKRKRTARRKVLGSRTRDLRSRSVRLSTVFFVVGIFAVFTPVFDARKVPVTAMSLLPMH